MVTDFETLLWGNLVVMKWAETEHKIAQQRREIRMALPVNLELACPILMIEIANGSLEAEISFRWR